MLFAKVFCERWFPRDFFAFHSFCSCPLITCPAVHLATETPHFIAIHFIALYRHCIFYTLKVCATLLRQVYLCPFSSLPVSVSHLGNSCHISNFFHDYCASYGDQ